jgi:hypothetical protein
LTIRNTQGLIIEDIPMYGLYANMVSAYTQSMAHKGTKVVEYSNVGGKGINDPMSREITSALPHQSTLSNKLQSEDLDIVIPFHHSSFLNRVEYFPTFLMRVPLRIEVEFQDPQLAFYYDSSRFIGEFSSRSYKTAEVNRQRAFEVEVHRASMILEPGQKYIFVDQYTGQKAVLLVGKLREIDAAQPERKTYQLVAFPAPLNFTPTIADANATVTWDVAAYGQPGLDSVEENKNKYRRGYLYAYDNNANLNYEISNLELLCDFVKPSSEVTLQYLNMFKEPSGITYPFTRTFYHNFTDTETAKSPLQISLPFGVRSLRGLMVVISDPRSNQAVSGSAQRYFKSLSTFMSRGLRKAQLRIGGQTFPEYELKFDTKTYVTQIPELEVMLNQSNNALVTYNFPPEELVKGAYNYTSTGNFTTDTAIERQWLWSANSAAGGFSSVAPPDNEDLFTEPSKFVLAISTMRNDGDFACGIDTNAAGSVSLSLTFDASYVQPRVLHIFAVADSVLTLQSQSNLVRY